ncbi:phage tail tape measure protein [Pseudomonas simiae]|uniref:phage tail tape measure protein n=1 Tax=Pseudomonas simiae TaxID=321846 RepID=UPI000D02BE21|nr:phage tail tape measure protein [Pseudomonas simiae]PRW85469.1 phage tail tape measure protein [Pseudomonas simiae]
MTSISELGIKVDSTDAVQASSDLDKMTAAGARAEKATDSLGETAEQAKARMLELAKAAVSAKEAQQNLSNVATGLSEAQQGLITSTAASAQAQAQAAAAQRATVVTTDRLAISSAKASAVTSTQQAELQQLLEQIDPTTKALNRLDEQERRLSQQKKLGLDPEVFSSYQAKIQQSRESLSRFDDSLTRTGNTARQNAAALRGVPAQFTDIFVSLQGGQAPLTVLLQQGGQLKDMFGGIGPAAKALGGYVAGLINPFTIAASAVLAFSVAAYKGYEQAEAYRKALTLTGEAAGKTSDDLIALSNSLARGRNFSESSQAVLALANNGRLTGEVFTEVARAATELSVATGKSAGDIADQMSNTKGKVSDLAAEYSDKYGVITLAVFEQVKALELQGDRMGAIRVLAGAVADEMSARNSEMVESTRGLARAWDDVKTSISSTWNELKVGLSASQELFKLQHLQLQLQDAQEIGDKALISGLEKQIELAQKAVDAQTQKTEAASAEVQSRRSAVSAESKWYEDGLKYRTDQKKLEDEITQARIEGLKAGKTQAEIDQRILSIRESYKGKLKKSPGAVDLTSFNDSKNQLNAVLSYYKSADKELEAAQKAGIISQESYTSQRIALLQQQAAEVKSSYEAEISALEAAKGKAGTSAAQRIQLDQKIADARANMVKAQHESESELSVIATNEQGRLKKQELAIKSYTDALDQQNAALQRAGSRAAEGVGLSDRQNAINGDLNGISDRANQQRLDLARDKADASRNMSAEEYQAKLEAINRSERDLTQTTLSNYEQMSVAQSDWRNGATSAFSNYLDSARDVAGQTRSLFTNAFSSMEDAVANFAITGKLSFSDFAKSIIADMARIATRQAASGLLSSLAGSALGAYFGGGAAAGAGSFGSSIGSALVEGRASGGPVDPNTLYEVNEKGPELFSQGGRSYLMTGAQGGSVTPLMTGSASIAAASGGGGGGGGNTYNFPVSVSVQTAGDGGTATQEDTTQAGRNIQQATKAEAEAAIARGVQPGGAIWRAINGR